VQQGNGSNFYPTKPYFKVKNWEYMVVKPQHIYGSYTFSQKKTNQGHAHHKITNSAKMKPYTLLNYKFRTENYIFGKQAYYHIVLHLITSQYEINPTYTCRISTPQPTASG